MESALDLSRSFARSFSLDLSLRLHGSLARSLSLRLHGSLARSLSPTPWLRFSMADSMADSRAITWLRPPPIPWLRFSREVTADSLARSLGCDSPWLRFSARGGSRDDSMNAILCKIGGGSLEIRIIELLKRRRRRRRRRRGGRRCIFSRFRNFGRLNGEIEEMERHAAMESLLGTKKDTPLLLPFLLRGERAREREKRDLGVNSEVSVEWGMIVMKRKGEEGGGGL